MAISEAEYIAMQMRLQRAKGKTLMQVFHGEDHGPERKLHDRIMEECHRRRWLVIHSRMDMPATVAKGVPDFIILAGNGRLLMFECKSRTGKLTIDQLAFGIMAETLGHKVHVVRSYVEFLNLIDL